MIYLLMLQLLIAFIASFLLNIRFVRMYDIFAHIRHFVLLYDIIACNKVILYFHFCVSIIIFEEKFVRLILFSFENFDIKLDTESIGRNFIYCEEVESTNALLLQNRDDFKLHGTVVLAEKQTGGRGRKDRKWFSAKDQNLTFSILLKNKINRQKVNLINFGTSLAIAYSLENLFQLRLNLKWPNDVLVGDEKIAGILLESVSKGSQIERLVVGIGLNVNQTTFQGAYNLPPTSVKKETGNEIDRERLLSDILNNFEEILDRVATAPETVLNDWKSRCRMIGEKITVQDDNLLKNGIFDDVDEEGFLILKNENNETERIIFGDVSLR